MAKPHGLTFATMPAAKATAIRPVTSVSTSSARVFAAECRFYDGLPVGSVDVTGRDLVELVGVEHADHPVPGLHRAHLAQSADCLVDRLSARAQ